MERMKNRYARGWGAGSMACKPAHEQTWFEQRHCKRPDGPLLVPRRDESRRSGAAMSCVVIGAAVQHHCLIHGYDCCRAKHQK